MAKNKEVFEYQAKISVDMSHLGNQIGAVKKALKETDVKLKATQVFSYDTSALICDILSDENSRALGFRLSNTRKKGNIHSISTSSAVTL